MKNYQETKREIISTALKGRRPTTKTKDGPAYPSKAGRGIYQSGPWSDSLDTTFAKAEVNKQGRGGLATQIADKIKNNSKQTKGRSKNNI